MAKVDGDRTTATRRPPGPTGLPVIGNTHQYARDPLDFFVETAREHGPVAYYELGGEGFYQLSDPKHVERVLVHNNGGYVKGERFQEALGPVVGNGLLTSEGAFWRAQRRAIQPAFHPEQLTRYAEVMTDYAERTLRSWEDGEARDVHADMMQLTVEIAAKALFDVDVRDVEAEIGDALEAVMDHVERTVRRPIDVPTWIPTPGHRRYRRALSDLDAVADRIIDERRDRDAGDRSDVVSLLRDADAGVESSREQIRDEVVTLLLAGHETTALTLTYALHLLSRNPEAAAALRAELDDVLGGGGAGSASGPGGRPPTADDLSALPYVEKTVKETMRAHPPVYELLREAAEDDEIGGYRIPAGSTVAFQQWVVHRDPDTYDDPETFRPERWTDEFERSLPRFAYFPFGGGPRRCIGDRFASMEARLVLATILREWTLDPVDPGLSFSPSITLRPDGPVEMVPYRR
ncbi:cytochrome P450 [Halegenticoccus soli]|uniref:cytochrome P450 n=1 Tax=Halegenticoccus soli TaxID=1985678 RepID=UPI000C6E6ABE|nr:cytochrome P450 [Halegenticoccus soli]